MLTITITNKMAAALRQRARSVHEVHFHTRSDYDDLRDALQAVLERDDVFLNGTTRELLGVILNSVNAADAYHDKLQDNPGFPGELE